MEAAVATPQEAPPEEPVEAHDGASEATRSAEELFQWSAYVHIGPGADECEHAIDGNCQETQHVSEDGSLVGHFHAWLCLPNQFQARDIAEKARAARARKSRALRDKETDAYAVLEAELDEVRRDHYEELVKVIAEAEVEKQVFDLLEELKSEERFEHHDQDMEELQRQEALPEEERDAEEYEQLQKGALAFGDALEAKVEEARHTERNRLLSMDTDKVIELERKRRIESIATEAYLHTYYTWAMYVGARKPTTLGMPRQRVFSDPNELKFAPDEIVSALREKISDLEQRTVRRRRGGDAAGN